MRVYKTALRHLVVSTNAEVALVSQVSHRERGNNALPEAQVQASSEQLSKKEVELCHARSAQRLSDAHHRDPGVKQTKQHSRLISLLRVKQRLDKAVHAIKSGLARNSSIEKKLTFYKFY